MWSRWRRIGSRDEEGQGLLELALALPVLLILFLGLIELGMLMRAKLVLVNANREAARFASRGTFTDEQVAHRGLVSFAGQLPARTTWPGANTGIIVTRFHVPAEEDGVATHSTPYVTGTVTHTSKIDPGVYAIMFKEQNDAFNLELIGEHETAARTTQDIVVVEIYYYHHQVLRAPIVEWVFPEPMVLYSRTTMRIGTSRVY